MVRPSKMLSAVLIDQESTENVEPIRPTKMTQVHGIEH
jgi:hypothetical protein